MASPSWEVCSTWQLGHGGEGSSLADHVAVRTVHSGEGADALDGPCIRLVPTPEKQPCEVTVRFTRQEHAIHSIEVLSTARTCEVYRHSEGDTDAEYLCTARGQQEAGKDTPLYRAEMDLEDPALCTSVSIRLLSLQEKSHVIIGHILISVSPGLYLRNAPAPAPVGGGASAAMMPLMLQMAQGFSKADVQKKMASRAESLVDGVSSSQERAGAAHEELGTKPGQPFVEAHPPSAKLEALLLDVCQRLERLESVCARMESSLSKALCSFDKRLRMLESGVGRPSET